MAPREEKFSERQGRNQLELVQKAIQSGEKPVHQRSQEGGETCWRYLGGGKGIKEGEATVFQPPKKPRLKLVL